MSASYMHKPASPDCIKTPIECLQKSAVSSVCQHLGNNYEKAAYLTELFTFTDSHRPQSKLQHTREKKT